MDKHPLRDFLTSEQRACLVATASIQAFFQDLKHHGEASGWGEVQAYMQTDFDTIVEMKDGKPMFAENQGPWPEIGTVSVYTGSTDWSAEQVAMICLAHLQTPAADNPGKLIVLVDAQENVTSEIIARFRTSLEQAAVLELHQNIAEAGKTMWEITPKERP